jgi:hypothetical protein
MFILLYNSSILYDWLLKFSVLNYIIYNYSRLWYIYGTYPNSCKYNFNSLNIVFSYILHRICLFSIKQSSKIHRPNSCRNIFLAEPVFGAVFSVFLGDKLGGTTLLACIIIFIGMIIININWKMDNIIKSFMKKFV